MSTTPSQDLAGMLLPPLQSSSTKHPKPKPRHQAFIRHYLETGNGTKSAIAAGYAEKSAAVAASRLLKNAKIMGAIEAALLHQAEMSGITSTYVLSGVKAIADDPKAKHQDKLRALELLGKHLKLWTDRVEVDVTDLADRVAKARQRPQDRSEVNRTQVPSHADS